MALDQSFDVLTGDNGNDSSALTTNSAEMLKVKPIVLPDHVKRRDSIPWKPKVKGHAKANGYHQSYGIGNGYGNIGNYGVSTGYQGNRIEKKSSSRKGGDFTAKPVDEDGWQICTRRRGGRKVFNVSSNKSQTDVSIQQIESGETDLVSEKGKDKDEETTHEYEIENETPEIDKKKKEERVSSKKKSNKDKPNKQVDKPLTTNIVPKPVKAGPKRGRINGFFKSKQGKRFLWVPAIVFIFSLMYDEVCRFF